MHRADDGVVEGSEPGDPEWLDHAREEMYAALYWHRLARQEVAGG